MRVTPTPSYFLIMIGGSLTISSSATILLGGSLNSYYGRFFPIFSSINQITAFALTLLPGLAILYLGQRFYRKPQTQVQSGLLVAALSLVGLFALIASGATIYLGIFFSGPPISFTGGLIGAFSSKTADTMPTQ